MLPSKALSVRQPWAWAIIHAGKDVENRSWQAVNHGLKMRGPIAIHASSGLGKGEFEDARDFIESLGISCPHPADLKRGGMIGSVEVIDVVSEHESKWFFGPRGLILANPEPHEFIPVKGALGYFNWRDSRTEDVPKLARWMEREQKAT